MQVEFAQAEHSRCSRAFDHAAAAEHSRMQLLQQQRCPPSAGWLDSIADLLSALRSNKQDRVAWSRNEVTRPSGAILLVSISCTSSKQQSAAGKWKGICILH